MTLKAKIETILFATFFAVIFVAMAWAEHVQIMERLV